MCYIQTIGISTLQKTIKIASILRLFALCWRLSHFQYRIQLAPQSTLRLQLLLVVLSLLSEYVLGGSRHLFKPTNGWRVCTVGNIAFLFTENALLVLGGQYCWLLDHSSASVWQWLVSRNGCTANGRTGWIEWSMSGLDSATIDLDGRAANGRTGWIEFVLDRLKM